MTVVGKILLTRDYRIDPGGDSAGFPADAVLGINGSVTRRALRMICQVAVADSFDRGQRTLQELMGWSVNAETIRRYCHAEAAQCRNTQAQRPERVQTFKNATGHQELQIDAGKVNTDTGWRDVKVASFAVRPPGPPSSSEQDEPRDLPKPKARQVLAAIETSEEFGQRCFDLAQRLGVADSTNLSILGDGASWIWTIAAERFPKASQNLDIYHAAEYLSDLAKAGFGEDGASAREWWKRARKCLVADGWAGVCDFVNASVEEVPDRGGMESAYPKVANYLVGHRDRMNYAARLHAGKSIGSGLIEGTIKQVVARRLKQTGACWKTKHVAALVEFVALADSPEWSTYWTSP